VSNQALGLVPDIIIIIITTTTSLLAKKRRLWQASVAGQLRVQQMVRQRKRQNFGPQLRHRG
jgi:hypothetical protein